jgi:hypothetical protein
VSHDSWPCNPSHNQLLSLQSDLWCVMCLIILTAVKFVLLSAFFTIKTSAVEIHHELCAVYGQNVMSEETVRRWCRMFKDGWTKVHDEEWSSQPSAVCDDLVQSERQHFTILKLSCEFPHILLYEIIAVRLSYHPQFCTRWVLQMLKGAYKMQRTA